MLIFVWQMLLPSGRWNSHFSYSAGWCYCQVADGMATTGWSVGRCYCHVADGTATGSYYLSLSSEVLNRTSSHIWGRWYLPMFLFRDGLLPNYRIIFSDTPSRCIRIMMSNISSDMNKPCWKLVKACPQSQILFCSRENNLPTMVEKVWVVVGSILLISQTYPVSLGFCYRLFVCCLVWLLSFSSH